MDEGAQRLEVGVSEAAQGLERWPVDVAWLQALGERALPLCLAVPGAAGNGLEALEEIEVTVVTDEEIAVVHGQFLEDPTATDVITFHHGEILISVETAARQGPEHGLAWQEELALYLIHGLLHLAGWDDHEPGEAARMAAEQERILLQVR
jgi:probable rRNA maturation factor